MSESLTIVGGAVEVMPLDVSTAMSAKQLQGRVQLMAQVMKDVMLAEVHFGIIPGTKKPSLWKAGSEKLLSTFRIAVDPEVEDLSSHDVIRYRVRCRGIYEPTGQLLGVGVGECSSSEEKYAWRAAVCDQEFDNAPEHCRREKYSKTQGGGFWVAKQIRTNPADFGNTVLKMAKKRAQIDMTLTVLAASDIFDQDVEADDDDPRPDPGPLREGPTRKSASTPRPPVDDTPHEVGEPSDDPAPATDGQKKMLYAKIKMGGISVEDFAAKYGTSIDAMRKAQVNHALEWIRKESAAVS